MYIYMFILAYMSRLLETSATLSHLCLEPRRIQTNDTDHSRERYVQALEKRSGPFKPYIVNSEFLTHGLVSEGRDTCS